MDMRAVQRYFRGGPKSTKSREFPLQNGAGPYFCSILRVTSGFATTPSNIDQGHQDAGQGEDPML